MFSMIQIYIQRALYALNEKPHLPGPHLLGRVHDFSHLHTWVTLFAGVLLIFFLVALTLKEPNSATLAKITNLVPTAAILLILGIISGIIAHFAEDYFQNAFPPLIISADVLQHALIFPILLYTSYKLYHQDFLRQVKSIVILGLVGTFLNIFLSAALIDFVHDYSWLSSMTMTQSIVFSSSISVVDPLAVVAVFKIHNYWSGDFWKGKGNFFLPFGSALVGYGVAMELFKAGNTLSRFGENDDLLSINSYLFVVTATFTDSLFGIITGVSCGLISAAITRMTSYKSQYFEPVITIGLALFSYVLCVNFGFSYIFATICCGLVQERYTFMNLTSKSSMNTENIIFALALTCQLFVYILVGYLVIHVNFIEVWIFALVSIIIIYTIRLIVTIGLSFFINMFRLSTITFKWQLLFFGGQRGPMSLAMVLAYIGPYNKLFTETTLVMMVFSMLVDGVMARYFSTQLMVRKDASPSAVNDLFALSSIYGGAELNNLLGVKKATNRNNCFRMIEKYVARLFISDQDRLSNIYRIQTEEERRLFFQILGKHSPSCLMPTSQKKEAAENIPV